jgi:dolichyl-phosphate beta-glucosyltransferase
MQENQSIHLSVVIPAYNEELRLPQTLADVLRYLEHQSYASEVIVVDDGSTDGTARLVRESVRGPIPLRVIGQPDGVNRGKGAAVRRGMGEASGRFRLFMDADNSTTIDHVDRFWPFFDEGYEVVIGSRDVRGAHIGVRQPWYKELAGDLGNLVIRAAAVPGIHDTQAGFKAFTGKCIEDILPDLTIDRWGFDVELLVAARCRGYRVKEVPIKWINAANSKVRALTYVEVLGEVWRVRRNRKAGRYRAREPEV